MKSIFSKESWHSSVTDVSLGIVSSILYTLGVFIFAHSMLFVLTGTILLFCLYTNVLIKYIQYRERTKFIERTSSHHAIIHDTRNLAIELMNPKQVEIPNVRGQQVPVSITGPTEDYKGEIEKILNSVVDMFKLQVSSGTKVWACLRERKNDDHYHTFIRAGKYNRSREYYSKPLSKESETIKSLKRTFSDSKTCVYITGSGKPGWERQDNDDLGEDRSVLMGAILSKSWNGHSFDKRKLNWILFVNSDKENSFDESHINLMKCCNDTLSLLLNQIIRKNYERYVFNADANDFEEL